MVSVLLISLILLILGLTFLELNIIQIRRISMEGASTQALGIARAGLEDARIKVSKDFDFPPPLANQESFIYKGEVREPGTSALIGAYVVRMDLRKRKAPDYEIAITSTGYLGEDIQNPAAVRKCGAILDISPQDRANPALPNPRYARFLDFNDGTIF
jgi:hypothetical protein